MIGLGLGLALVSQSVISNSSAVDGDLGLDGAHHPRSVLTSNVIKPKTTGMTKSVGLGLPIGLGIGLSLPLKSASPRHSRPSLSPTNGFAVSPTPTRPTCPNIVSDRIAQTNRKRKLEYLSFEEKLKRKKLKNRVAAQTSRDRKKARMDELEVEVKELKERNNQLVQANFSLQREKEKLTAENQDLRDKLLNQRTNKCQHQAVGVGCSPLIIGPAASVADPLPQGRGLQPAPGLCRQIALWKILTFCILSQISLQTLEKQITPSVNLKNLQQVCFEKLMKTNRRTVHMWMKQLLTDVENGSVPMKWWGRQQKTWNPMED